MELPNIAEISAKSIQDAYMEWLGDNSPEKIKEKCLRTLNDSSDTILRTLLGFSQNPWSKEWKLDHCSGHSGESAAGDYIRKNQKAVIDEWLSQVKLPQLTEGMRKSVQASAKQDFSDAFKERIKSRVRSYASHEADRFFEDVIQQQKDRVAEHMKVLALIAPLPKE